jgi:hypothetical protein
MIYSLPADEAQVKGTLLGDVLDCEETLGMIEELTQQEEYYD